MMVAKRFARRLFWVPMLVLAAALPAQAQRSGFDPSAFLDRLDKNDNGMLDLDEREGPAGFIIRRMKREDPNFNDKRPIPLKEFREAFERMRRQRDGGRSDRGGRSGRGDNEDGESVLDPNLLVPGFGNPEPPPPVPGFGGTAELFDVTVRPEDEREAADRLRRYDRNRNGFLDANELSDRWEGNPMDFDRNRDGKLSKAELTIRYARRREGREQQRARRDGDRRRGDERRKRDDDRDPVDIYMGAKSFRNLGRSSDGEGESDLPELFSEKDANGDQQVAMSEFASEWTAEKVKEFYALDHNGDGVITLAEFRGEGKPRGSDVGQTLTSRASNASGGDSGSGAAREGSEGGGNSAQLSAEDKAKYRRYSERIIQRADKNGDGKLDKQEQKAMYIDVSDADYNRDGFVDTEEYYRNQLEKTFKK